MCGKIVLWHITFNHCPYKAYEGRLGDTTSLEYMIRNYLKKLM